MSNREWIRRWAGPNSGVEPLWLAGLLLLALAPRVLGWWIAVAPARDALRYFHAAELFSTQGFVNAVRMGDSQPLYPLSLWACRALLGGASVSPLTWLSAAQGWSIICYGWFLVGSYLAGRSIWGRHTAFWGVALLCIIPRQIHYSIDVLSDNLHAALWMSAFAGLLATLRSRSVWTSLLAGFCAGLAYCTRFEGLLVGLVFLSTLAISAWRNRSRWTVRTLLSCLLAFLIPWLSLVGGYAGLRGGVSARASTLAPLGGPTRAEPAIPVAPGETGGEPAVSTDRSAEVGLRDDALRRAASKERDRSATAPPTFATAAWKLFHELGQEARVVIPILAGIALLDRRGRRTSGAGGLACAIAILGCCAMLMLLYWKASFLAGRYLTPILPIVCMLGARGVRVLGRVARRWSRFGTTSIDRRALVWASAAVLFGALNVPGWFEPLHPYRHGHMSAARWLAHNTTPHDPVFDPTMVSAYFAGRVQWQALKVEKGPLPVHYAAIDPSAVYRTTPANFHAIERIVREATLIERFPQEAGGEQVGIYLYRLAWATDQKVQR